MPEQQYLSAERHMPAVHLSRSEHLSGECRDLSGNHLLPERPHLLGEPNVRIHADMSGELADLHTHADL
jgi:hypothetical protein